MRTARWYRLAPLLTFVWAAACANKEAPSPSGLMIFVSSDMPSSQFDSIRVEVSQEQQAGSGQWHKWLDETKSVPQETKLPTTVFIQSGSASDQDALIQVTALSGGSPVVLREAQIQIPTNRVAEVVLVLSHFCAGQVRLAATTGEPQSTCTLSGQSCQPDGVCRSSVIDSSTLPTYVPGVIPDAATPGVDATASDGSVDAFDATEAAAGFEGAPPSDAMLLDHVAGGGPDVGLAADSGIVDSGGPAADGATAGLDATTVDASPGTGGQDGGATDVGSQDNTVPDVNAVDAGSQDVTTADMTVDATTVDAGGQDGGAPDVGSQDGTASDVGAFEAGSQDVTTTDTAVEAATLDGSGPDAGDAVLMHHKNLSRDGVYVQPTFTKAAIGTLKLDTTFNATLTNSNDHVFAQPLYFSNATGGRDLVIVATEANNVYALDAASGSPVWVRNLGVPAPGSIMQCGNINPLGVTSTPVIDPASRTLFVAFVDAQTASDGAVIPRHRVAALSVDNGTVLGGWPVDISTAAPSFLDDVQGQRGALAILNGTLYVPYGGLFGDCGNYHGWLIAISIANPSQVQTWSTSALAGGAWGPGGVSSDGTKLYITTGNTSQANSWGGGEALLAFTPGAAFSSPQSWAATNWMALDNADLDLGGSGPIVFDLPGSTPSQLALALGKDGNAYLLDRSNLAGVGAALAMATVATTEIINAAALYTTSTATYAAFHGTGAMCAGGTSGDLTTIRIVPGSPPSIAASWCATAGNASPIVTTSDGHSDPIVWQLGAGSDNLLHAFDGDTGAVIPFPGSTAAMPNMRHFNAPIAAKGRIFVAADGAVFAFTL